jgi:hypothetical protein
MSLTSRIVTLLTALTDYQVRAMPPVERAQLAAQCKRLLNAAEPQPVAPKAGVLGDLKEGRQS